MGQLQSNTKQVFNNSKYIKYTENPYKPINKKKL